MTPVHELHLVLGVSVLALAASAYNIFRVHKLPTSFDDVKQFVTDKVSAYVSSEVKSAQDRLSLMDRRLCSACKKTVVKFDVALDGVVTCHLCKAAKPNG